MAKNIPWDDSISYTNRDLNVPSNKKESAVGISLVRNCTPGSEQRASWQWYNSNGPFLYSEYHIYKEVSMRFEMKTKDIGVNQEL